MGIQEILYTKHEAFTVFSNGNITRQKGNFEEDPEGKYIHDKFPYPKLEEYRKSGLSDAAYLYEYNSTEQMNALAKQCQRQEYRKRVLLVKKQWKAQQPSLLARLMEHVRA